MHAELGRAVATTGPARGRGAVRAAVPGSAVPGAARAPRPPRAEHGADEHAAVDQDRRLPGGLRVLPAERALRHGAGARGAAWRSRRYARRAARARRPAPRASAWAPPIARRRRRTSRVISADDPRGARAGAGDLRDARHAHAGAGASSSRTPGSTTTTTIWIPRRSSTARSSPRAPTRTGSTRSRRCATPA